MRKVWILIPVLVVIAAAVGIFMVISNQNSKPKDMVTQFESAVDKGDTKKLTAMIEPDNKAASVNKTTVNAFIAYLKKNSNSMDVIKDSLKTQVEEKDFTTTSQAVSLVETDNKWGIFKTYKFKVKTVTMKVNGQNESDKVNLTVGKEKMDLKEKEENVYGPLLPGLYKLNASISNDLGTFIQTKNKDLWGNAQITHIIDTNNVVEEDKKVQDNITKSVETFNSDLSVYETSEFDATKLTTVTDAVKKGVNQREKFDSIKMHIQEVQSQYLGSIINYDAFDVSNFNKEWKAELQALVNYNGSLRYKDVPESEDLSYTAIRTYKLKYDKGKKEWLIYEMDEKEADGTESDYWTDKKNMKVKNPPVMKWTNSGDKSFY
ncbi:TcaA second domain-containing protein [Priestia koreensis]|uniref:TcaA second domain-containing protein n=1 Tax=Priestia koreensis TaxID=284581 RepID=UPI0006A9D5B2|nr:hypothetical protein [Priestia koreensis]